jgi:hypothetical protein
MPTPTSALIAELQARPDAADRLVRAACAELRAQPPESTPSDAALLRAGLARIGPSEDGSRLDVVLQRLIDDTPRGAATEAIAALLRPSELAWDEAQEIDWAVRHWEACRAEGGLDEELAADFGEYWRRLEWSALRQHLAALGTGHAEERRLLAHIAKTASRYVALAPLKRAMEARYPELFDLGFSLR